MFDSPLASLSRRASSSDSPATSTPSTLPASASAAASRVRPPVPQPMSRTRSRGPTRVAARNLSSWPWASSSITSAYQTRCSERRRMAGTTTPQVA